MLLKKMFLLCVIISYNSMSSAVEGKKPPKLKNFGATCFQNATLQVLYNIQPITNFLVNKPNPYAKLEDLTKVNEYEVPKATAYFYTELVKQIHRQVFGSEKHYPLLKEITHLGYALVGKCSYEQGCKKCSQEDAAEFFGQLLDSLVIGKFVKDDPIGKLTAIELVSIVTCPNIQYESVKVDIANKLEVPIRVGNKILKTLNDCLDNFIVREQLEEYTPEGYAKRNDCFKQLLLGNSPDYIVITLKRFLFHEDKYRQAVLAYDSGLSSVRPNTDTFREKINDKVNVQQRFDSAPYMIAAAKQNKNTSYELMGVIHHGGRAGGGHYIAFVKNNNQWYSCNDDNIQKTNWANIQDQVNLSYLLIYQRQQPALGMPNDNLVEALKRLSLNLDALSSAMAR